MMKKKLRFRKRLYCSVVMVWSLFVACGSSLHAANNCESGGIPMVTNDSQQSPQESKVGTKAPDFTIMKDGKSITLANFRSRYKVLNFSSSSPESRKIRTDITTLEEKYKNADVVFINISIDENADIAREYGVSSTPAIYIIKPNGTIRSIDYGNVDLTQKMKKIFGR